MSKTPPFFSKAEEEQIIQSIVKAEKKTSGEIRVHLEATLDKDPHERALEIFHLLGMKQTKYHNSVLLYLATKTKNFVIYGDQGIHKKVPDDFWKEIKDIIISNFKKELYVEGVTNGITKIGEKLKEYFPIDLDDINELSNQISKR